jgi:serine/threonine protein kinase
MAETPGTPDSGQTAPAANGSQTPPVVRPELVLPAAAEASDDTPTVISKAMPSQNHSLVLAEGLSLRGRSLAHFELLEPIGVGGMAAVIRARDKQLDRFVALKILPPEMAVDQENVRRFHQEARSAAKLDHENIARVFFCGEDQNLHFIAFEFVEGDNLRALLDRRGRLPVPEAVRYMLQIATGLEHAASRGVVHRDIKPSNIIITPTGRAKLVDMGLARSLEPHSDIALTQSGVTLGTFDYISPEQALEPREADARSDIYSLGCTFYHVLTGQSPVPEGTAAKKLVHHRDVAPLDPRQLNPEIPDEVAGILARMMAKDPKDRYQRPVHLVQHLMQVAQHVGAAAEVPEGVLFLDTPLPNQPRKRPALMVALATVFLAGLLFVQSLTQTGQGPQAFLKVEKPNRNDAATPDNSPPLEKQPVAVSENKSYVLPRDLELLRTVLAKGERNIKVVIKGDTDLSAEPLVFNGEGGRTLHVEGSAPGLDGKLPCSIRLQYQPEDSEDSEKLHAGILLNGGAAHFKNVRFETEASLLPRIPVAAVLIQKGGTARFEGCWFNQGGSTSPERLIPKRFSHIPLASVAVENPSLDLGLRPSVQLDKCYFQAGQDAIAVNGSARVVANNCAFGAHGALFHLRGKAKKPESEVVLQRCDYFLENGPAFRLDGQARCSLTVSYSIFSYLDTPYLGDEPALILQSDDVVSPHAQYFGRHNIYHNLNSFWIRKEDDKDPTQIASWEDFKLKVAKNGGAESMSVFLRGKSEKPWAYDPLTEKTPKMKFQLSFAERPELRDGDKALGIQECVWGEMVGLPTLGRPAIAADPLLGPDEKLVDVDARETRHPVYKTLGEALAAAEAKGKTETIYIKCSNERRELALDPRLVPKADVLTIKPYKDCKPLLTLAETDGEPDAVIFKLYDNEIRLENLEILLKSTRYKSQAVVSLFGDGKCDFRQCVLTFKESRDSRVVVFGDPGKVMKMPSKAGRQMPEAYFKACLVRGEGELVQYQVSRAARLDMENCLVALAGSLVTINANLKEPPMEPQANLKLTNVSALLTGALVRLQADEVAKGFAKTNVDAQNCLFAALAGKALIRLDKLNFDQEQLNQYLPWIGKTNAYTGFNKLVDQPDSMMFLLRDWTLEPDARMLQVKFKLPARSDRPLSQAVPSDFLPMQAQMDLQGYGANLRELPALVVPPVADTPPEMP